MTSEIIKLQRFKCCDLEKFSNRVLRLILVDIMKPTVALEYLTDNQIERIQKMGVSEWEKVQIVLDDHCYFTKRNTVVRQHARTNAANMSVHSNHYTNMTTFKQLNSANDTSQNTPGYNDVSSIDSGHLWNTSFQSDDENISQYTVTESNASTPYRMSESDLQEIYVRDNEMAANNMNLQNDDNSLDSYYDEFDDGNNDVNNMNDNFDMSDEHYDDVEGEDKFENDENDFADFESIITQLTNKGGLQNTDEHGKSWRSTEKVFNNICLKHLHNKCSGYESLCRFNHNLPKTAIVARNLYRADEADVEEAHQLLMVHDKLLLKYWPTFCSFYGCVIWRENLRLSIGPLSLMDGLCIEYNLLSHVLDGFMKTGMNYALCVEQIMLELDESLSIEEQFYAVWQIIIDPRNTAIKSHLKPFSDVMLNDLSSLNVKAIKQILSIQIANETIDIRALTVNILKRCIVAIFYSIDPAALTEYILYLRAYDKIGSKAIQLRADSLLQQMR